MKNSLILIIAFLIPIFLSAQKFSAGVRIGQNTTFFKGINLWFNLDTNLRQKSQKSVAIGVCGAYAINKWLRVRSEIAFEKRGFFIETPGSFIAPTMPIFYRQWSFSTLTVPVLPEISIGRKIRVFIFGGPNFGFKLKSKPPIDQETPGFLEYFPPSIEERPLIDFSFLFGTGMAVSVQKIEFAFDFRKFESRNSIEKIGFSQNVKNTGYSFNFLVARYFGNSPKK